VTRLSLGCLTIFNITLREELCKQTPGPPTSRGNDAAASGNTKKLRCTHQGCPSPKLTTHLRASIMLNLFSIANASARRPPVLLPFSLPSPAINLAMAPLPLMILVCLILILQTLHVCLLLQHPRTRQHHLPLPHSGHVSRPRLPLATPRSTATRRKAPYSIAAPR